MTESKTDNKREAPISYRPPAALREEFFARVERSGLSTNAFLTQAVFGQPAPRQKRAVAIDGAVLARLLGEAASIRDALHEITLSGGDTPANALRLEAAMDDLAVIRAALIKAYGRKP